MLTCFLYILAGSASPSLGRKEYRKVNYEGSTLSRTPSKVSNFVETIRKSFNNFNLINVLHYTSQIKLYIR